MPHTIKNVYGRTKKMKKNLWDANRKRVGYEVVKTDDRHKLLKDKGQYWVVKIKSKEESNRVDKDYIIESDIINDFTAQCIILMNNKEI
tara:strand:+ start:1065 stop:1331 length:267 start_codon:yes stop_codon:yes gene_type:complete